MPQMLTGVTAVPDMQLFYSIKHYLDENYLENISLRGLCRQFVTNEFKLKKGFKACFGYTVFGYITALRMQKAQALLLGTDCTISEVADKMGYSHASHFTFAFGRYFGYPPSVVRRAAVTATRQPWHAGSAVGC